MKAWLTLCFLLMSLLPPLFAQQNRGVTPVSATAPVETGTTRAVVIGISDYENKAIPDLKYADKDAEAFAAWLLSPAGGSLPPENLILLLNEKATIGRMADALIWLLESSQPGDQAIIYFSGHGDVETYSRFNQGYLLTYDSPPKVYLAGAFNIRDLQVIISTLSDKNVQVVMISDACRAGKLAGNEVNGTQATAQNLSQQFANEVKILSCQPNEFSLEGEQWGGGRGAFSYHLLDGLQGLADKNGDAGVNLFEIRRYLEDHVPAETAPHSQMPFTVGDRNTRIATVDPPTLARLREQKTTYQPQLAKIENKGMEELLLADADSSIQEMYAAFEVALEQRQLLEPAGTSAYDLYQKLAQKEESKGLHNIMRRRLSVALQDDAQQAVNAYLVTNPTELQRRYNNEQDYSLYPRYLAKACELLGPQHFYYNNLMAKRYYFEGLGLRLEGENQKWQVRDSISRVAIGIQQKALEYEPQAPFVLNELGVLHTVLKMDDEAFRYLERAIEAAPNWGLPYVNYCVGSYYTGDKEKAQEMGEQAIERMPDYPQMYNFLGWIYADFYYYRKNISNWRRQGIELKEDFIYNGDAMSSIEQKKERYKRTIELLEQAVALDSNFLAGHSNLGLMLFYISEYQSAIRHSEQAIRIGSSSGLAYAVAGESYRALKEYDKAEPLLLKAIDLDINRSRSGRLDAAVWCWGLGDLYSHLGKNDEAIQQYKRAIELSPGNIHPRQSLSRVYTSLNEFKLAEYYAVEALFTAPKYPPTYIFLGNVYRRFNRIDDATWMYQKALELYPDYVSAQRGIINLYRQSGKWEKALEWLEKALKREPENLEYLANADNWYYQLGEHEKAETYAQQAMGLLKDDAAKYNTLAFQYLRATRYAKALGLFQKAIELGPGNAVYPYNVSCTYARMGDPWQALTWLEQALEKGYDNFNHLHTDPDIESIRSTPEFKSLIAKYFPGQVFEAPPDTVIDTMPRYHLENTLTLAGYYEENDEPDRAAFLYKKAVELPVDTLTNALAINLAEVYLKLGQIDKARAICPEKIESEIPADLLAAGKLFYLLGKNEAARMHFEKYVSKSGSTHSVGSFYRYHAEFTSAEHFLTLGMEVHSNVPAICRNLARLYFFSGKKEAAFSILQEAIALQPSDPSINGLHCMLMYYDDPVKAKALFDAQGWSLHWETLELMRNDQFEKADAAWAVLTEKYSNWWLQFAKYKYLQMKVRQGKPDEALKLFEALFSRGLFGNYKLFIVDKELDPIRNTEKFKELMRRYFPEKTGKM